MSAQAVPAPVTAVMPNMETDAATVLRSTLMAKTVKQLQDDLKSVHESHTGKKDILVDRAMAYYTRTGHIPGSGTPPDTQAKPIPVNPVPVQAFNVPNIKPSATAGVIKVRLQHLDNTPPPVPGASAPAPMSANYATMKVDELKQLCRDRKIKPLPTKKADLIDRLMAFDAQGEDVPSASGSSQKRDMPVVTQTGSAAALAVTNAAKVVNPMGTKPTGEAPSYNTKTTVADLKALCRSAGLLVGGVKSELLERLDEHYGKSSGKTIEAVAVSFGNSSASTDDTDSDESDDSDEADELAVLKKASKKLEESDEDSDEETEDATATATESDDDDGGDDSDE